MIYNNLNFSNEEEPMTLEDFIEQNEISEDILELLGSERYVPVVWIDEDGYVLRALDFWRSDQGVHIYLVYQDDHNVEKEFVIKKEGLVVIRQRSSELVRIEFGRFDSDNCLFTVSF